MKYSPSLLFFILSALLWFSCDADRQPTQNENSQSTAAPADTQATRQQQDKVILFFGNSLTAGYGLEASQAFPALIQQRIDSLNYPYKVVNAGLSGETTASGNNRLDWVLERQPVDIFVLELGANDGLRGLDLKETRKNLEAMINKVKKAYPEADIVLTGMMVPPNMGQEYSNTFQQMFPDIAQKENVTLIPFLLENVAGEAELNQADGVHPTAEGHKILRENVWAVIHDLMKPSA